MLQRFAVLSSFIILCVPIWSIRYSSQGRHYIVRNVNAEQQ